MLSLVQQRQLPQLQPVHAAAGAKGGLQGGDTTGAGAEGAAWVKPAAMQARLVTTTAASGGELKAKQSSTAALWQRHGKRVQQAKKRERD